MLNVTITIEAKTEFEVEQAAEEALRLIKTGVRFGSGSNANGNFFINTEGEEEETE